MSYFNAKKPPNSILAGAQPQTPRWMSSQHSPKSPSWILRVLLLREGKEDRGQEERLFLYI